MLFLLTLLADPLPALEPVVLNDTQVRYPLDQHVEILVDRGNWTIEEVSSAAFSNQFIPSRDEKPQTGGKDYIPSTWIRFTAHNTATQTREWAIKIISLMITYDRVDFFIPAPSGSPQPWIVKSSGDIFPFQNREVNYRWDVFRITIDPNSSRTFYLRFEEKQGQRQISIPLVLWSWDAFSKHAHDEHLAMGAWYGLIIVMALYNLFLFFSLRDIAYLYYTLTQASLWFMLMVGDRHAAEYLWPERPWEFTQYMMFAMSLGTFCIGKFAQTFLLTRINTPQLHRIISFLQGLAVLWMIIPLLGYHDTFNIYWPPYSMIWNATILWAGIVCWRQGYRPARFFLIAWALPPIAVFVVLAYALGAFPLNFLSLYGLRISYALEAVLLSLALADRINMLRREKESQEASAKEAQLRARTAELQAQTIGMGQASDFENVLSVLAENLETEGLTFDACGVDLLEEVLDQPSKAHLEAHGLHYTTYTIDPEGRITRESKHLSPPFSDQALASIERVVSGEAWQGPNTDGTALNLEIPIAQFGRLLVTASDRKTFLEEEIDTLKDFAGAIALGYTRYLDFQRLERQNKELEVANQQVQEATDRKSRFLASMSHELRTPMNAIIGFTRIVLRRGSENLSDQHVDNLMKVQESANHLLALITEILDLSKIEAGRMEVEPAPFDLKRVILTCCATVESYIKPGVELKNIFTDEIDQANTDGPRLRQIVLNLLTNALKFTDQGEVIISTDIQNPSGSDPILVIQVSDTGIGIAEEDLPLIFEEFQQAQGSEQKQLGTGLGLPISKAWVELMGGSINAESKVGEGSTFTVHIPAVYKIPQEA